MAVVTGDKPPTELDLRLDVHDMAVSPRDDLVTGVDELDAIVDGRHVPRLYEVWDMSTSNMIADAVTGHDLWTWVFYWEQDYLPGTG